MTSLEVGKVWLFLDAVPAYLLGMNGVFLLQLTSTASSFGVNLSMFVS